MSASSSNPFTPGSIAMIGLRALDVPFQYRLITSGYAAQILHAIGYASARTQAVFGAGLLGQYSLGGLDATGTLVLGMMGVASARHVYWTVSMRPKPSEFSFLGGTAVGIYNFAINLVNTLTLIATSSRDPMNGELGWKQYVGVGLFVAGILWEIVPEEARKAFKAKPENKGRLCDVNGFGIVRQPNYFGYTLWRTGITLATGNLTASALQFAFQVLFFTQLSIPNKTQEMAAKYGEEWKAYTRKVPYAYIPFIY